MNRLLITAIALAATFCAGAQLRYGLRIGGGGECPHLIDAPRWKSSGASGFSGGLTLEYQIPVGGLAFDVSLLYSRSGAYLTSPEGVRRHTARDFIEIPLHVKYKFWMKKIFDLAGPYVYTGPTLLTAVGNGSKDAPFRGHRLQPGWNIGAGFDVLNFIQIQGGYRFGLGNSLSRRAGFPGDGSLRADGWSVSAAFLFDF